MPRDAFERKPIRIQKYLSEQGLLSRRQAEAYIKEGWIKVNGKRITEMGVKINPDTDQITFDKKLHTKKDNAVYLAFFKPRGVVTNCPQDGETQITDLLPARLQHVSSIGRLDKDSEGLILLTDDGIFAKRGLQEGLPKTYLVWVNALITDQMVEELHEATLIGGKINKPCEITVLDETYMKITLYEGKNRQIRKMIQQTGRFVVRLKRIQYGQVFLENLQKGHYRDLTEKEKKLLPPR